jgi:hypothetical protein
MRNKRILCLLAVQLEINLVSFYGKCYTNSLLQWSISKEGKGTKGGVVPVLN